MSAVAIRVENLSKKFSLTNSTGHGNPEKAQEFWALKDISFEIKKGESVGVFGPNGSGKSTLLKILAGVTKPTSGVVELNGRVASILEIGAGFHPELSGKENVFLNGQILGFSKSEMKMRFDEIVDFSGVEKFIDEPVKTYSNGMYLRLAFSIMAHLDFDIYLFDEVMNVGDFAFNTKTRTKQLELINRDKTVVHVSHELTQFVNKDLYISLDKGSIAALSKNKSIIDQYIENELHRSGDIVYTREVEIRDFNNAEEGDIILRRVSFYQEELDKSEDFRSDYSFTLEVEYQKVSEDFSTDLIIGVLDKMGNPILSLSPFVDNHGHSVTAKGTYVHKCKMPPKLFHSQVYRISLLFVKDLRSLLSSTIGEDNAFPEGAGREVVEIVAKMSDILLFRPLVAIGGRAVDLSKLNLNSQLLVGCEWSTRTA